MVNTQKKKADFRIKRANLINSTSLDIIKQKKLGDAARVAGNRFARQFALNAISSALTDKNGYLVALRNIEMSGGAWDRFLAESAKITTSPFKILPVAGIRSLYSVLLKTPELQWLLPILSSSSTYLLTTESAVDFSTIIKHCVNAEGQETIPLFEVLFIKDQNFFLDFRRGAKNSQDSVVLRDLYVSRSVKNISFELCSVIMSTPLSFTDTFSVLLPGVACSIYPRFLSE